ncbi:MAG: peptide chain release factor N(5)-glutamine methyltransferase [Gammaproteobacteria bacterium]|nr:peptide chain release factor N(5)-glutamine methyltransferase [Gammaproteobacteria bacterium]
MDIATTLKQAKQRLAAGDSPALDAEVLLAHVLGKRRIHLLTWPEQPLTQEQERDYFQLIEQRYLGTPVAHLTGQAEFWSLPLNVNPHTLIPRPETELLVETTLSLLPADARWEIVDLGTGSGAIALALASERSDCTIHAVERSADALEIARHNAAALKLEIQFHPGSWFEPLTGMQFDLIVSNPPYIPLQDPHLDQGDVRFEPDSALSSGSDGLDDIRHIIHAARQHLRPGGWLLLEHGYDQGDAVAKLFLNEGYKEVDTIRDLAGHPRIGLGRID